MDKKTIKIKIVYEWVTELFEDTVNNELSKMDSSCFVDIKYAVNGKGDRTAMIIYKE